MSYESTKKINDDTIRYGKVENGLYKYFYYEIKEHYKITLRTFNYLKEVGKYFIFIFLIQLLLNFAYSFILRKIEYNFIPLLNSYKL